MTMFTGIVDHCGRIEKLTELNGSLRLKISTTFCELIEGESIAVDGACLTVVSPEPNAFLVEVSPETLRLTTMGNYQVGSIVNLERALRMGDRLGGHFVMGHVDGIAKVQSKTNHCDYWEIAFDFASKEGSRYLIPKGSISVNGVSLTLNQIGHQSFTVMLIPHTLGRTNLKGLEVGSQVNLEFDWLTKVILSDVEKTSRVIWERAKTGVLPEAEL